MARPDRSPAARPPAVPAKETNFYAGRALVYGVVIFILSIVLVFVGRPLVGIIAAYTIYLGIRGLATATSLRTHTGVVQSLIGLILGDYVTGSLWAIAGPVLQISTYKIFI